MSTDHMCTSSLVARAFLAAVVGNVALPIGVPTTAGVAAPAALARAIVLTAREVGVGFSSTEESFTPNQLAEQGTLTLAQLNAWGYEAGFERVFDRDLNSINGLQIASNAGIYRTPSGAAQSLIANGNACTLGSWQILAPPSGFAQGAVFCTETGIVGGTTGQLYFLVWRIGRFKGSISLSGVVHHVSSEETVGLARRQEELMRVAV